MVDVIHQWNPDDWEAFALSLLQGRHGPLGVHKIPANHKGDLGIDYYCTSDAVIYQCYAVEEPLDVTTRAERQKSKITTDLRKIVRNGAEISRLFSGKRVRSWILLAPTHDSKLVNLHCAKKTTDLRVQNLTHLDVEFEVGIHDQDSFPGATLAAAMAALASLSLTVPAPSKADLEAWQAGAPPDLLVNATRKLSKRVGPAAVEAAVADAIELFLKGNALVDALRLGAPDLHEKVAAAISGRGRRLSFVGPQGGSNPSGILNAEVEALIAAIKEAAPSLSSSNAEEIALGVVSEWLMRCPLDFPSNAA